MICRDTDSRSTDRRSSNASINHGKIKKTILRKFLRALRNLIHYTVLVGTTARVGTPEGYRDADTLRMTDRLSKVSILR